MSTKSQIVPVWFFIGLLLVAYGIIITVAGVQQLFRPASYALAQYHSGLWGGIVLLMVGSFYTVRFWPGK